MSRTGGPSPLRPDVVVDLEAGAGDPGELRNVIDNLPAMIGYWDHELRNKMANAAYVEWFGRTPEQMRGQHIRDVLGERLFALNEPFMLRALAGESQQFERTIVDAQGIARHTQASYTPNIVDGQVEGFFVLVVDITKRKAAEHALADESERVRAILDAVSEGVVSVDIDLRVDDLNTATVALTGLAREQALGNPLAQVLHIEDHVQEVPVVALCQDVLRTGVPHRRTDTDRLFTIAGRATPVDWAISPLHGAEGDLRGLLITLRDVGGPRRLLAETEQRALHDPLTGLKNRRFLEHLHWRRHSDVQSSAVIFLDLDGFKRVNDTAGHAAGDAVLQQVGDELRKAVRESDSLVRVGGDEFAIVLQDCSPEEGMLVAQNVVDRVEHRTFTWHGSTFRIGVSAGMAFAAHGSEQTVVELIQRADAACLTAKRAGGHRLAVAD